MVDHCLYIHMTLSMNDRYLYDRLETESEWNVVYVYFGFFVFVVFIFSLINISAKQVLI